MAFLLYRPWIEWGKILGKRLGTYVEIGRFHSAGKILGTE